MTRRILHLTAPGEVGGLERVVQGLALGQRRRGNDVQVGSVLAPGQSADAFLFPLSEGGVRTHVITVESRAYLRERSAVERLIAEVRPDIVHTHGPRPDVLHAGPARRAGAPVVSTVHGSSRMGGMSIFYEWLQLRMLARHDAVVAVSRPLAPLLSRAGVSASRLHVIPNAFVPSEVPGLDRAAARLALGLPADGFAIGWVGRLIDAKGADVFVQALLNLPESSWIAGIVGDGPERASLEALVRENGASERVRFLGSRPAAQSYLAAFDVLVLSSRTEGTPMTLLEGIGAGLPVIATSVGGIPDVISEREGILVPAEDPRRLAEAIDDVRAHRESAVARARAALRRLRAVFDIDTWLDQYDAIYAGCESSPRAPATLTPGARSTRAIPASATGASAYVDTRF